MDQDKSAFLFGRARHCRDLARTIEDKRTRATLTQIADEYEARARDLVDAGKKLTQDP